MDKHRISTIFPFRKSAVALVIACNLLVWVGAVGYSRAGCNMPPLLSNADVKITDPTTSPIFFCEGDDSAKFTAEANHFPAYGTLEWSGDVGGSGRMSDVVAKSVGGPYTSTVTYNIDGTAENPGDCSDTDTVEFYIVKVEFECVDDWGQWLPEGGPGATDGNEIRFKATISPPSAEGLIRFNLQDTTAYKGYCVNAPSNVPASGLHSGSWEDLKFTNASSSTEWTIESNGQQATTTGICNTATVVIKSFDYAAWGRLSCMVQLPSGVWCDATYVGTNLLTVPIPKDGFNGIAANTIGDAYEWDDWADVTDDTDLDNTDGVTSLPSGITADDYIGDGLAVFEEYRGFVIKGAHERLNPYKRDLFTVNGDGLDASHFDDDSDLKRHELAAGEYELNSGECPLANVYRVSGKTCGKQHGVKLVDDGRKVLFWFYTSGSGYYAVKSGSWSGTMGSSYIGIAAGPGTLRTYSGDIEWLEPTTLTNEFAHTIPLSATPLVAIEAWGDTVASGWEKATTANIVDASAGSIELEFSGNIKTNGSLNIQVYYAYGSANADVDKHCRIFAHSDADKKKLTVVHEMGHTVSLQHHSSGANTNGDSSCHMTYNDNTTGFCTTTKSDPSDLGSPDLDAGHGACYYRIDVKEN